MLTDEQIAYFETFCFLALRKLLAANDMVETSLTLGFEILEV